MKKTTWKTLSQQTVFRHPRLTVYEDAVELPNGYKTSYLHFGFEGSASMIIAVKGQKILLQREYSYPTKQWLFQFPGGGVEDGETEQEGAARELAEEAKLSGTLTPIGQFYLDNRRRGAKMFVYIAHDVSSVEAPQDPEEDIESYWFSETEIDAMIQKGEIINITALAGWTLFKTYRRNAAEKH